MGKVLGIIVSILIGILVSIGAIFAFLIFPSFLVSEIMIGSLLLYSFIALILCGSSWIVLAFVKGNLKQEIMGQTIGAIVTLVVLFLLELGAIQVEIIVGGIQVFIQVEIALLFLLVLLFQTGFLIIKIFEWYHVDRDSSLSKQAGKKQTRIIFKI